MHIFRCLRPAIAAGLGAALASAGHDFVRERLADQLLEPVDLLTALYLAAAVAFFVYLAALSYPVRAEPTCLCRRRLAGYQPSCRGEHRPATPTTGSGVKPPPRGTDGRFQKR